MKGKKAMMDDLFDLVFTIVAAFFTLIFLSGVLNASVNNSHEITLQHLDEYSAEQTFVKYLESPATVEGQQMTVADLIVWSVNNNEYGELDDMTYQLLANGVNKYIVMLFDREEYIEDTKDLTPAALQKYSGEGVSFSPAKVNLRRADVVNDELDDHAKPHFIDLPNYQGKEPKQIRVLFKFRQGERNG